jgi:hypothetical protein
MSLTATPLEKVGADICAVEVKILDAEKELNAATEKEDIVYWRKEKEQLRQKEMQLRKEKEQLREEKLLLLKKDAAPNSGKYPLYPCSCSCSCCFLLFWCCVPYSSGK